MMGEQMKPLLFTLALLLARDAHAAGKPSHRLVPSLKQYYYGCITGNDTYVLIASKKELDAFVKKLASQCQVDRQAYLALVAKADIDFDREALVLIEKFYGGTGMARASLNVAEPKDGVVVASIVIRVPPPPLTPDVARFPFAFAVAKAGVKRVDVVVGPSTVASLPIAGKR